MMRKCITGILLTLVCCLTAYADDREQTMYAAVTTSEPVRWQQTSLSMTPDEYLRSVDNNQEIVQQKLQAYSEKLLASAGVYAPAVSLLGAAVSMAAKDRRYSLNDSKTMRMVFRDPARSRRAVLIEYRKIW